MFDRPWVRPNPDGTLDLLIQANRGTLLADSLARAGFTVTLRDQEGDMAGIAVSLLALAPGTDMGKLTGFLRWWNATQGETGAGADGEDDGDR